MVEKFVVINKAERIDLKAIVSFFYRFHYSIVTQMYPGYLTIIKKAHNHIHIRNMKEIYDI